MSEAEFDSAAREGFVKSIAAASGVLPSAVEITGVHQTKADSTSIIARSSFFQLAYTKHVICPQRFRFRCIADTRPYSLVSSLSIPLLSPFLLGRVSARAYGCSYVYIYAGVQSTTLRRAEGIKVDVAIQAKDDAAASDISGVCHV